MRMIYTRNDTPNKMFGFCGKSLELRPKRSILFTENTEIHYNSIQVKSSRPLNDDETEAFNQI